LEVPVFAPLDDGVGRPAFGRGEQDLVVGRAA
jgi:hypothetical protein